MSIAVTEDALQGSLSDFPLAALMRSLGDNGRTGALSIEGGDEVWFSEGQVYLVTTATGAPISAVVYGADVASLRDLESMFAVPEADRTVLDAVLANRPEQEVILRRLLHEYNLGSLFELLVPSDRGFGFQAERRHRLGDRFAVDTSTLLAQAEHRVEIWRRIAARIPSTSVRFQLAHQLPDAGFERLVSSDEWQYLARLDGEHTVADVINLTDESAFRVCSTLYRLLLEGLIVEA